MTDRLRRMYSRIKTDHQHIGIEKFKIITKTEAECAGYPAILRRGQTLKNVLEQFPIFIGEDELFVGNPASKPWGLEIEAGLGKWSKEECEYLREDGFDFSPEDQEEMLRINEQLHPFFGRIICASCGQPYHRCLWKNRRGETTPMWKCSGRARGKCYARIVKEDELTTVMAKAERVKVTEFGLEAVQSPAQSPHNIR